MDTNTGHSKSGRKSRFEAILQWRKRHISDNLFVFVLAVIVGALAGAGAFALKTAIATLSRWLTSGFNINGGNLLLLALPIIGILLTGIYLRYILHDNISHGTARLLHDISLKMYRLKRHLTYSPIVASTITLGFGGSAGAEGPIAYTGAAIGSNIGQAFRLSPRLLMILVGCGAGAGISGIFRAPLGGTLFTLEVLSLELSTLSVLALLVSAITSWMVVYICSGFTPDLVFIPATTSIPAILPMTALLGVFCGLYSLYYSKVMAKMTDVYEKMRNPWIRNLTAGAVIAVLIYLFPTLYGEGYGSMAKIFAGDAGIVARDSIFHSLGGQWWGIAVITAGILLAKCFATSATNSGGGVAGDFAPTLFAGCIAGLLFATVADNQFGADVPVADFAFIAMAGVMAGAIRAPLMAIFLTVEMSGCYSLLLPVIVCVTVSYGVVRLVDSDAFYLLRESRLNRMIEAEFHRHDKHKQGPVS
ncbi:MAG: chloride channel protein [Pseudoflavonifractor sp.]|nr:chloride channel protein [Pseudoflavonifractor sp.]